MMRALTTWILSCALLAIASPTWADEARHVRIVLDTSKSMRANDPDRLATLSALLLYDLMDMGASDTFSVLPFHPSQKWDTADDQPPTGTGPTIRGTYQSRGPLVHALRTTPYHAKWTYYYPGIKAALEDLRSQQDGPYVRRVVILLTDGLPEQATREAERKQIRQLLREQTKSLDVQFYVLAFGPEAPKDRAFFEGLFAKVHIHPTSEKLLHSMIEIFSTSFGYEAEELLAGNAPWSANLSGGLDDARSAIVLVGGKVPPTIEVAAPSGQAVTFKSEQQYEGLEAGASYALRWVLSPADKPYDISFSGDPTKAGAILRPRRLKFTLQTNAIIADQLSQVRVLLHSERSGQGDPGPHQVRFRETGPFVGKGGNCKFTWCAKTRAVPASAMTRGHQQGRTYEFKVKFPAPRDDELKYIGHLELEALKRGRASVAASLGKDAPPLEVYRRLKIVADPKESNILPASARGEVIALRRGDSGCVSFSLMLDAGTRLPLDTPSSKLPIQALLPSVKLAGPLEGARFALDGHELKTSAGASASPGGWSHGRLLSEKELLGKHKLCVKIGRPTEGKPGTPIEARIVFTLQNAPYDQPGIVQPFTARLFVAPPSWWERFGAIVSSLVLGAALLLVTWLLRYRPGLPQGLQLAFREAGGWSSRELGPLSPWSFVAGPRERAIFSPAGDKTLGWVRPIQDGLYAVRPAWDVTIAARGEAPRSGPVIEVEVRRAYEARTPECNYTFQLEYR